MINPDTLKRLAKGVDDKRTELMCIHVKDTYAEVTDGKMLIRETVDGAQKETYLESETFQPVEVKYPDTANYLQTTKANPTLYKIGLGPNVLRKFLSVIPKDAEQINFEIKGAKAPIYFECGKLEGLIMPMAVEEVNKPAIESKEPAKEERSIAKVTILNTDGKEETLDTSTAETEAPAEPAKAEPIKPVAVIPVKPVPVPVIKKEPIKLESNLL